MGELINLRRAKKANRRVDEEHAAAANRLAYGTPKHLRKAAKAEKTRAVRKLDAHKRDTEK